MFLFCHPLQDTTETVRGPQRPMPPRLMRPFPPQEPNWRSIGWGPFRGMNVENAIWAKFFPPNRNKYANCDIWNPITPGSTNSRARALGIMSDAELSRLNVEIRKTASLPKTGKPNSKETLINPDETPKQERWYGPDGEPIRDRDYNHPGDFPFPHDHLWEDGVRQKDHLTPSPNYKITLNPSGTDLSGIRRCVFLSGGTVGAVYVVYRGVRMIPSLFPPFWVTILANLAIP